MLSRQTEQAGSSLFAKVLVMGFPVHNGTRVLWKCKYLSITFFTSGDDRIILDLHGAVLEWQDWLINYLL